MFSSVAGAKKSIWWALPSSLVENDVIFVGCSIITMDTQLPPGLTLIENFIDADEEARLMAAVDAAPWDSTLKRRVQHYGMRYDYDRRTVTETELGSPSVPPIPEWCGFLVDRLDFTPDQLIINEYLPGQGIARHTDAFVFGSPIVSLSLGSTCEMVFRCRDSGAVVGVILPPRSLLIMDGDARSRWTHEIPARLTDCIGGRRRRRTRRVSLTFRVLAH